jgi:hypothetical protein
MFERVESTPIAFDRAIFALLASQGEQYEHERYNGDQEDGGKNHCFLFNSTKG